MNKQNIIKALKTAREGSKQRKFSQTFDLIISLKGLNLKKPEDQVEFFVTTKNSLGKKRKVCALVGPELADKAKEVVDKVILSGEFDQFKDKKVGKQLAKQFDFFIAQADVMPKVAGAFGKVLGPRGKMPNPKAGQILPPKGNVQPVYERLQKTVKISAKKQLAVQSPVGSESMSDEEVAENVANIYNQLIHHLPQEKNNIKNVYVKLTMGKPIIVG